MKNLFSQKMALSLVISTILTAPMIMSCSTSPKDKLDDATTEVVDASADLVKANDAYLAEVVSYKADAEAKIAENEAKIMEYNADMKIKKSKELKNKVAELTKKTVDLKQKLADFKAEDGKETWSEFKTEFNHDMEGIGQAMSDLTVSNTKK